MPERSERFDARSVRDEWDTAADGCASRAHYPINPPLEHYDPKYGFRLQNVATDPDNARDMLVVLLFQLETFGSGMEACRKQSPTGGRAIVELPWLMANHLPHALRRAAILLKET